MKDNVSHLYGVSIALLLFLPTTALVPASVYYVYSVIALFALKKHDLHKHTYMAMFFLSLSLIISLSAGFFSGFEPEYYGNFIPLQVSFICALVIAPFVFYKRVIFWLLILVLFEFFIAHLQFVLGVKTFFSFVNTGVSEVGAESTLLYYRRVYGLGANSSSLIGNVILSLVLVYVFFNDMSWKKKVAFSLFAFSTVLVSFSRSGLLAFVIFHLIVVFKNLKFRWLMPLLALLCAVVAISPTFVDYSQVISQVTRGRGTVELSGRSLIWFNYLEHIYNHSLFGNFSLRNYLDLGSYGKQHAHSSYIMLLYVLGLIPLIVAFIPVFMLVCKQFRFMIYFVPALLYSSAQFFLFWGVSIQDILFWGSLGGGVLLFEKRYDQNNSFHKKS